MPNNDRQLTAVMDIDITQAKRKLVEITKQGNETVRTVKENGRIISETVTRVSGATATGAIKANTAWTALMTTWTAGIAILGQVSAGVRTVVRFMTDATRAAQEDQKAIIGRNAALQATGQYTYEVSQRLDEQASQLQRTLGISDTYTVEIQRQMAAQRLNVDQIEAATKASLGLSRVMGGDLADNTKQITQFLQGHKDKLKNTTVEVDKHADAQERLAELLEGSAAGLAILNAEAETTAGRAHTAAEAWGEIKETIGGQIGNSPDMASAFKSIADALFKVNDGLKSTGGLGGLAAQGLLVLGSVVSRVMGRLQMAADFFEGGGMGGWGLPGGYTNPFLQADFDLQDALAEMQAKNQRYDAMPPGMKGIYDLMSTVKEEVGGGLRIPGDQVTTPNFKTDVIDKLPKRKDGMSMFGFPQGFRPQPSELEAAVGYNNGPVFSGPLGWRLRGRGWRYNAYTGASYNGFGIPDLSGNGTVGMDPRQNALVNPILAQPQVITTAMRLNHAFGQEGLSAILGGVMGGGLRGGLGTAGSLAGGAFGGPIGSLLGGFLGKGLGKLFGGGGGHDPNKGMTPGNRIYTDAHISNVDELARASNASRALQIGGASNNVNWAMMQLNYAAAGGQ